MTINPANLLIDIGQIIRSQTGIWFGSMDIANALARALCGERLAIGRPVTMTLTLGRAETPNGPHASAELRASPNRLPAVAVALNACGGTDKVTEAIVTVALMEVMRLTLAGVIVVAVSCEGELTFETAGSLAELMKRRAMVTIAERRAA